MIERKGEREPKGSWYQRELTTRWIGAGANILTALGVLAAVYFFVRDQVTTVELEVLPPAVVEFRCSTTTFDAKRCFEDKRLEDSHLSISAAFHIAALGPAIHRVSIDGAAVKVRIGKGADPEPLELHAFWRGDLTGGYDPDLDQVVSASIAGGETISNELWFFPQPVICFDEDRGPCPSERANYRPWHLFYGDVHFRTWPGKERAPEVKRQIHLQFSFEWRRNGERQPDKLVFCTVDLGKTAYHMIRGREEGLYDPLYITLPCRERERQRRQGALGDSQVRAVSRFPRSPGAWPRARRPQP